MGEILTQEMESVGIRLNQKRPDIYFKEKKGGGLSFNSTVPLTHMDEKAVRLILGEYKIHNAEVLFREDATADQFIDAILGTRIYMKLNLDYLVEVLWEELKLIRIYTKKPGHPPDFDDGIIFRSGITVKNVCDGIHRTLAADFKYALAWGRSTKFSPQRVGLTHQMEDEDVIMIVKK